jgi:hypothetical protein
MAEEADKLELERAEARVVQLRAQIANKRAELGAEIDELRRRRRYAIERGKTLGKAVGIGAVSMMLLGSLTNAVIDLFSNERSAQGTLQAPGAGIQQQRDGNSRNRWISLCSHSLGRKRMDQRSLA